MVEKRVEMELYPFDDLWGGLSFVDKETSGVVCQQVGTNYLRGHMNALYIDWRLTCFRDIDWRLGNLTCF